MADNYLEKRYDEVFGRSCARTLPQGKPGVETLARRAARCVSFNREYEVMDGQLEAIVRVAALTFPLSSGQNLKFLPVSRKTGSDRIQGTYSLGTGSGGEELPMTGSEPEAFIIPYCPADGAAVPDLELGAVCQSMLLKAAELGLRAAVVTDFDKEGVRDILGLPTVPVVMLAFGRENTCR